MNEDSGLNDRTRQSLLTLEEVAVYLQVSHRTVERYIKDGHIRVIRISKRIRRVLISDLEESVARMREFNG